MKIKSTLKLLSLMSLFLALPAVSQAESSEEYALMSKSTWAALACSSHAMLSEPDNSEAQRLIDYGLEQGEVFLNALNDGKIQKGDINTIIPISMLLVLRGPNHDFILGRIYETVSRSAQDGIYYTDEKYNPPEIQKAIAKRRYSDGNCSLIGR